MALSFKAGEYTPEKVTGGAFEIIEGSRQAKVNSAEIVKSKFDEDKDIISLELEIVGEENAGRKLWRNIDPQQGAFEEGKKSKFDKFRDELYTCGIEFVDEETLKQALQSFTGCIVKVWCGGFKNSEGVEKQWFKVQELIEDASEASSGLASDESFKGQF